MAKYITLALALAGAASAASATEAGGGRPWTVADSIGIRYFVYSFWAQGQNIIDNGLNGETLIIPSPDGRHFFISLFAVI